MTNVKFNYMDTIVAISSGNINQAISIVRIVGPDAINIIKKIFTGKIGQNKTIQYGFIKDNEGKKIDEVLVSFFVGTDNFVGENTIEINAHGGIVITKKILDLIIANGARLANPGEFTRRAYLNGKISLMKAEGINDIIHSKTSKQHDLVVNIFNNENEKKILEFIKKLEYLIGLCEINIDYPEYDDIPILENEKFNNDLKMLINELKKLIDMSNSNRIFMNSLSVAIVGNPNVGKSSLMNTILNHEKSIVTNIPGTTRDVVESEVIFNNFLLKFKDTAGLRESIDEIEKIGIERTWKEIDESQIIIHVIDSQVGLTKFDEEIIEKSKNKKYICLWNKSDLLDEKEPNKIYISTLNKDIIEFNNNLEKILINNDIENNNIYFNERQNSCLQKALNNLNEAYESIKLKYTYDVIIVDLHNAWEALKEMIGEVDKEELLDSIFKNFCLGK